MKVHTITWILCGSWGSFTEIWKRPGHKSENRRTALASMMPHTTRIVVLGNTLGLGAVGGFLRSLSNLYLRISISLLKQFLSQLYVACGLGSRVTVAALDP